MGSFFCGLFGLVFFFVPIICPLLGVATFGLALQPVKNGKRRAAALTGCVLALVGVALHLWIWRFGHLP